ncbi:MAG: glycosyl hydrolase family 38 [Bacteroidales bacterium]|nr:glycosyl hydrolase family 38 [Bacteroidales bacterium]
MKRSVIAMAALLSVSTVNVTSQSFFTPDDHIVNGFSAKISGLDFEYHSCIPGLRESILVRATGGKDMMEWETAPVPEKIQEKYAAFVWVAALGSSPGNARMDLETGGGDHISFYTDGRRSWDIEGDNGSSLSFRTIMTDQHGDHHGYMILRVPSGTVAKDRPLRIRVTGSSADLTSWYMTFRKPVETGVTMNAFPAILKNDGHPMQLVEAGIFYFGDRADARIFANGKMIEKTTLNFGYNAVNLGLPAVKNTTRIALKVVAGDFTVTRNVTLEPVRKWKISFIQHAHTDIGYTRSQTEILAEHLRYIDYALDYCDVTDSYPENAKFRWTCEASWPVDEYLKCRPKEQCDRLIRRIKEGRIEVTGMYFNFDEIPDEQILAASLQAAGRIRKHGIPVTMAMQNDVNGIGWCLNDYFDRLGVKYLNMGTHGHRALICFDRPTMFWWESPSGKRMLTFRAEHYMTGNTVMEVQSGDTDKFKNNLLNYLNSLASRGYPYDEMAIQHSGYLTDNSPPSTSMSEMIIKWNELFEWPVLTTSTTGSFFEAMEGKHGSEFPVIRGAWPDWWTDGFGASAREVAATRTAAASLLANTGGLSMAAIAGIGLPAKTPGDIDLANEALLFYTEHTTGYSESVREPYSQPTMEQRALKESYAWEATRRTASLGEVAMGLLQDFVRNEAEPSLVVFNTLNWSRSGLAMVYIDHQIVPRGMKAGVYDHDGNRLATQPVSSRSDGTYWAVWFSEIPAFGFKKYLIKPEEGESKPTVPLAAEILDNEWYTIEADLNSGIISSLFDKELSLELVDKKAEHAMGEFILEQLGNRSQMESRMLNDFTRKSLDTVWFESRTEGEIWNSIRFCGETETAIGPRGFSFEIRAFKTAKRIEMVYSIVKKSITDPESFYIAFPFAAENGRHFTEVAGGVIETGKDQIRGSSNDWYTVQNFTAVRNGGMQIVMGSNEMPLMQFGAINTGRYEAGALPQTPHVYSWPMNNYWVTNFNADQRGGHTWTYYLTSSADTGNDFATRFGWGARVPILTRILPGGGSGDELREGSFITGWPSNVILISARPEDDTGKSLIIHLRETGGQETALKLANGLTGQSLEITEVDVTGNQVENPSTNIFPLENKFFKITLP